MFKQAFVSMILASGTFNSVMKVHGDDWPQWLGPRRDGVWRETGVLEQFPAGGPAVKWRAHIGGGYAGPAVANGRVYVTDRQLAPGAKNQSDPFNRAAIPGQERVLCLNQADGRTIWQHEYPCDYTVSYAAGPRTTPLVSDGKVYTLGAEGNLFCFDAVTGKVIWARELKKDFGVPTPLWGFSAHPLLDGNRLVALVGGSGSTVVAFDKDTGREIWRSLTAKEPGYSPPTLIQAGGRPQLIVWHTESVNSLDPSTGAVYWSVPWQMQNGLDVATPRQEGQSLFLTCFYGGSMLLHLDSDKPAATVAWKSKKASEKDTTELHSIMSTPFFENGYLYGVCSYGELRALKAETGERLWETLAATTKDRKPLRWANAFLVKNDDRFFLFNELGDLIIARLTPQGYEEISRAHLLEPTNEAAGRPVVWSHPAFANRTFFGRNDKEIIAVDLARSK